MIEPPDIKELFGISESDKQITDTNTVQLRYPALRTISGTIMIFAWIVGIASLFLIFYFLSSQMFKILSLVTLLLGGFFTLILAATSESIKVLIDIEENTRKSSEKQ